MHKIPEPKVWVGANKPGAMSAMVVVIVVVVAGLWLGPCHGCS